MKLSLFVTDLDNTFVGTTAADDAALETLSNALSDLRRTQGTKIVYSTGRSLESYRGLAAAKDLLTPDVLVTAVGTEIYRNHCNDPDLRWTERIQTGWERPTIEAIASQWAALVPQPSSEQRPFKVSYYIDPAEADPVLSALQVALRAENLPVQIVYSGSKDVDILPQVADKGSALEFLRMDWRIPTEETVACGDSGNDRKLFTTGNHWGIIVGNAQPELKVWHEEHPSDRRYFAQGSCAQGILEGLRHFKWLKD